MSGYYMETLVTVKIHHFTGEEKIVTYDGVEAAMELVNALHVAGYDYAVQVQFDIPGVELTATLVKGDQIPF